MPIKTIAYLTETSDYEKAKGELKEILESKLNLHSARVNYSYMCFPTIENPMEKKNFIKTNLIAEKYKFTKQGRRKREELAKSWLRVNDTFKIRFNTVEEFMRITELTKTHLVIKPDGTIIGDTGYLTEEWCTEYYRRFIKQYWGMYILCATIEMQEGISIEEVLLGSRLEIDKPKDSKYRSLEEDEHVIAMIEHTNQAWGYSHTVQIITSKGIKCTVKTDNLSKLTNTSIDSIEDILSKNRYILENNQLTAGQLGNFYEYYDKLNTKDKGKFVTAMFDAGDTIISVLNKNLQDKPIIINMYGDMTAVSLDSNNIAMTSILRSYFKI